MIQWVLGMTVGLCSCAGAAGTDLHTDVVDPGTEYQILDHFGASDCWSMQKLGAWSEQNRERIAERLFSADRGIGLSCWRFNLGGGINHRTIGNSWRTVETFEVDEGRYDWTRQAGERWFLRAAKRHGVPSFVAFVNSPPGRMTRNGLTNCAADSSSTNLKPGYEVQFARYLADILRHFQENPDPSERIAFDFVSPVNEPSWQWLTTDSGQEGNRASNLDIQAIVRALHAELERQKVGTRILIPEARSPAALVVPDKHLSRIFKAPYNNYVAAFCDDPNISGLVGNTLCYHAYLADLLDSQLVQQRLLVRRAMDRYPGWRLWQTEYCVMQGPEGRGGGGRDLSIDTALDVARVIHCDLTLVNASAWSWWTAVSPCNYKDGLIYTTYSKPGDPETILEPKLLWAFGNFSRFVRPGMKRIGLVGAAHDLRGLLGSAYKDPRTGSIVIVYINLANVPQKVRLTLSQGGTTRALRRLTPYVTSDNPGDDLKRYPGIGPADTYEVPARSVVTLVGE
jgi:hypothetical protein